MSELPEDVLRRAAAHMRQSAVLPPGIGSTLALLMEEYAGDIEGANGHVSSCDEPAGLATAFAVAQAYLVAMEGTS